MLIEPKSKLVMIGDSITDAGRQPAGEGRGEDLGRGYVSLVDAMLQAVYPAHRIRVVNMGTSGHTALDLAARWQRDVIERKPDWLSIMIGINDVWRQFDTPLQTETHVGPEMYEKTLAELARKTRPGLKGMVMMTPFFIEASASDSMRAMMDRYGAIVKKVAAANNAIFVDTQAAFEPFLKDRHSSALGWDRVHPSPTGHMILALAFLKAIQFEFPR